MVNNEKLLEAARMIQEHCEHTEMGYECPFAYEGVCDGIDNCLLGGYLPYKWIIPESRGDRP